MQLVKESINFERGQDPMKAMGIGFGNTLPLNTSFPISQETWGNNSWYSKLVELVNNGYLIRITMENKTMWDIYKQLYDIINPFFLSSSLHDMSNKYHNIEHPGPKNNILISTHHHTNGRYDINSSNTWSMDPEQKKIAHSIYKGKNNDEYPFYIGKNEWNLTFIISKSGKLVTLVFEGECPYQLQKWFDQLPGDSVDCYLRGWKKPDEIVTLVKEFYKIIK